MSNLPEGWAETTLGELADWGSGGTPSRSEPSFYGGTIPWIKSGELNSRYITTTEERITEAAVKSSSAKLFPAGSVAIAMYGATIGKTAIIGVDASTNQACAVGIPVEGIIGKEFLYRLLQNEKEKFIEKGKGGAQPNISQAVIKAHEINLPPLAEQTRIVQKLDELLAQVDTLKSRIDAIPTLLKRFRQSVLSSAFSGRLTDEWRAINSEEHAEQTITKLKAARPVSQQAYEPVFFEDPPSVPKSWEWATLGFLASPSEAFCYGVVQPGEDDPNGIYLIRAGDLNAGSIDTSKLRKISSKTHQEYKRSQVNGGEVLVTVVGAGIGEAAIIPMKCKGFNIARAVAKIPIREVSAEYVHLWLSTTLAVSWMKGSSREVARPTLNIEQLKTLPVPLPALREQTEIVHRVEQLFALADQLEAKVASTKSRIDYLTQSILAKAFRGELVPQDSNDEPASVLLARIKAQRAAASNTSRTRKNA